MYEFGLNTVPMKMFLVQLCQLDAGGAKSNYNQLYRSVVSVEYDFYSEILTLFDSIFLCGQTALIFLHTVSMFK